MKALFIAYYFPPDSSSGSFRPLFFANHLSEMGVDVHVLTSQEEYYLCEQPIDRKLLTTLSEKVKVTRCTVIRPREAVIGIRDTLFSKSRKSYEKTAESEGPSASSNIKSHLQKIKDTVTDFLAVPDPHVGWLPDCVRRGKEIIAAEHPDLIFATGSPWSGLIAAAYLKKHSGIPLILDFRDPWVNNPAAIDRNKLCRVIDQKLEHYVVSKADIIVANTDELREDFLRRYPNLKKHHVDVITNGFESYLPGIEKTTGGPLTITHTGALYFSRNPVHLLQAIYNLISKESINKHKVRLQFVGGIEVDDPKIGELLSSNALNGVIDVIPRVPYAESIKYVQKSDVLLLIQPDFPLQIPRKLYEYMAAKKPLFCIAEPNSATTKIIEENGLGYVCDNNSKDMENKLQILVDEWQKNSLKAIDENSFDNFLNKNLANKLKLLFSEVCHSEKVEAQCLE